MVQAGAFFARRIFFISLRSVRAVIGGISVKKSVGNHKVDHCFIPVKVIFGFCFFYYSNGCGSFHFMSATVDHRNRKGIFARRGILRYRQGNRQQFGIDH